MSHILGSPFGSRLAHVRSDGSRQGRSEFAIRKAIEVLTRRGELSYTGQRKYLIRDF